MKKSRRLECLKEDIQSRMDEIEKLIKKELKEHSDHKDFLITGLTCEFGYRVNAISEADLADEVF